MNKTTTSLYKKFRAAGHSVKVSKRSANILADFQKLESEGLVRMRAEPEQESYMDIYGEPEPYVNAKGRVVSAEQAKAELIATLDRYGCWWTCSEYKDESGEWQHADSCGMHTGYEDVLCPFQNCYVIDEMSAAVDAAGKI